MGTAQHHLSQQSESVFTKNRFVMEEDALGPTPYENPSRRHRPSPQLSRAEYRLLRHFRSHAGVDDLREIAKAKRWHEERGE